MPNIELAPLVQRCESFLRAWDDWEAVRVLKGTSTADISSLFTSAYWQLMQLELIAGETFKDVTGLRSDNAELLDAATRIRRAIPALAAKLRKNGKPVNLAEKQPFKFPPAKIEILRRAVESAKRNAKPITAPDLTPTIWFHGERQYSIDGNTPYKVSQEHDSILQAFLESQQAMETRDLEDKSGATNASRAVKSLNNWMGGIFSPAIRIPQGKAMGGYFARVLQAEKRL